jgi:hypothetical protein
MSSMTGSGAGSHGPRMFLTIAVAFVLSLGACGGEAAAPGDTGSPTTPDTGVDPTTAASTSEEATTTTSEPTESDGQVPALKPTRSDIPLIKEDHSTRLLLGLPLVKELRICCLAHQN